ncbi:MAG: GNAT family N-acetyltransferase [Kaiparowitsia implicata GSE-PSE-MK54-09C]|jgi:RimJ/RimL family protein N-acetyltransferase|nr:GNAT family N-acetyltransferase [Kaiparowitsia implicata GSE-PSE-MK54-09C]
MTILTLTPANLREYRALRLAALHEQPPAFGTPAEKEEKLPLEAMASRLQASKDTYILGAFSDDSLVGTIRFSRFEETNEKHRGFIAGLYVRPEVRRRGIARALATEVLARARRDTGLRRIHLTVVTAQEAAIQLYKSLGFRIYGTEHEAFSNQGQFYDEYLMELLLQSKTK